MNRFMFAFAVLALLALAVTGTNAQIVSSGAILVQVDVTGVPLEVVPSQDLVVVGLNAGFEASLVPDGADAFIDNGNDVVLSTIIGNSTCGIFEVNGDPAANVLLSFALPTTLAPSSATVGRVNIRYNGTSACATDPGSGEVFYFDPTVAFVTQVPADGSPIHINLGGIFNVAPNSAADVYQSDAIMTAAYTAN
jgi:hypothetical protein